MLNGVAPLIVFQFPQLLALPTIAPLTGIPVLSSLSGLAVPIPLYLDEKLTGLYVVDETMGLDVETNVQFNQATQTNTYDQRGVSNSVTVSMLAKKDNILLAALVAFMDIIFTKLVQNQYSVSYFNGSTVVLGGLVAGFNTQVQADTDLIQITLHLLKQKQTTPVAGDAGLTVSAAKTAGTAAGPTGVL